MGRRIKCIRRHAKKHNWFTSFVEFLLIITGVLAALGIQSCYDNNKRKKEYRESVGRLQAEIEFNISEVVSAKKIINYQLFLVQKGLTALNECNKTKQGIQDAEVALRRAQVTHAVSLMTNAIQELNSNPRLISQQNNEERQFFSRLKHTLEKYQREFHLMETIPFEKRVEDSVNVGFTEYVNIPNAVPGFEMRGGKRFVFLKGEFNDACNDDVIKKSLYEWEKWHALMLGLTFDTESVLNQSINWLEGQSP